MPKLSIIIPSRDEKFLVPTIDDIFRNARGEVEVVTVIDSNLWPEGWKETVQRHSPRLHTIFHGTPLGMRRSINDGVASAISRGAKFVMKADAHCSFSEGFDEVLKAECESNWVVVPRRGRLDPENWVATDTHKPDIDYHYLSFPDDPNDFGGPGLNGKVWNQRALERKDISLDEEMSSQGSCWFMHADYFGQLDLMDEARWGTFWCEFQEIGLRCWLSGGQVMVNKKAKYLHLHKGKKYGRGYHLDERELQKGRNQAMLWPWNEEWAKQTLPFKWLIEHFWPVPSWPENWEEMLYATRKPRVVRGYEIGVDVATGKDRTVVHDGQGNLAKGLVIIAATYGIGAGLGPNADLDVTERLQHLTYLNNGSLDIIVSNSTLCPGQNPHRGKKKSLTVTYAIDGGEPVTIEREEKDWLIIGPVVRDRGPSAIVGPSGVRFPVDNKVEINIKAENHVPAQVQEVRRLIAPQTPAALNDYLIRKFSISPQRLRGPMPIELRDFHRNDLAKLFAELGFKRGAEIGVAEGNYSEVLLKANPECELLLVDPWHTYSENPQGKSKEKHEVAYNEMLRKVKPYPNVRDCVGLSMDVVQTIGRESLDFIYIDGNHLFDYVMQDLIEWSKRVRSGGIISGDDYYALDQKRWVGGGVVEAVQAYVNAHRIPIWWLFEGHKSVDYFWCKP